MKTRITLRPLNDLEIAAELGLQPGDIIDLITPSDWSYREIVLKDGIELTKVQEKKLEEIICWCKIKKKVKEK